MIDRIGTIIEGIRCEMEPNDDRPGMSLFLFKVDNMDGAKFSGSMALCEHMGGIPYDEGGLDGVDRLDLWPVSSRTFEKIEKWAVGHGY